MLNFITGGLTRKIVSGGLVTCAILLVLLIIIAYMIYDEHQYKDDAEEIPIIGGNTPAKYNIASAINPDSSAQYPRASGILCNEAGKEYIFIGGRANESDAIYSCVDNKSGGYKIIPIVKLPKYKSAFSTACIVLRLRNCEYDDIIIARTDGLYLLIQKTFMDFTELKLWDCPRGIYVSAITAGDIAGKGNVFLFVGCSRTREEAKNIKANNKLFMIARNIMSAGTNILTDITDKFPHIIFPTCDTISAAFADFTGNGFPDLLIVNAMQDNNTQEAGKIILFRNINGEFIRQDLTKTPGKWGGIALGDINNSGKISIVALSSSHQSEFVARITRKPATKHTIFMNYGDYLFEPVQSGGSCESGESTNNDIIFPAHFGHAGNGIIADINDSGRNSIVAAGCADGNSSLIYRMIPQFRTGCIAWTPDDNCDDDEYDFIAKRIFRNREFTQNILCADLAGNGSINIICINKLSTPRVFASDPGIIAAKKYINVVIPREIGLINSVIELKFKDGSISSQQFIAGSGVNCRNIFRFGLGDKSPLTLTIRINRGGSPIEYMLDRLTPGATYRAEEFTRI